MPKEFQAKALPKSGTVRLAGLGMLVSYPIGRMDIEHRPILAGGELGDQVDALKLVVTDAEARALSKAFSELADKIESLGGSKQ